MADLTPAVRPANPFTRIAAQFGASDFARHVATLASGQGIAMVVPILIAPILGRLYTPADYGLLGAFMGVAGVFGVLGNWQFAQAIPVQRTQERAEGLFVVSVWASLLSALLALVAVAGLAGRLGDHATLGQVSHWFWVLPISTLAVGVSGALTGLANKRRDYGFMSAVTIATVATSALMSIGMGLCGAGAAGLLLSFIAGQLVSFAAYAVRYGTSFGLLRRVELGRIAALAKWQAHFPIYSLPAAVLRSFSLAVPTFALVYLAEAELAGHFSRAQTLLALPIGVVGMALAQVFQERAAREKARTGSCWSTYRTLLISLIIVAPIGFALLAIVAPPLFVVYLGPHWKEAGYIAQLLAPMMCLRMIAGPLWPLFAIFRSNKRDFFITACQFVAALTLSLAFVALGFSAIWQVIGFAIVSSFVSLTYILQTFFLARQGSRPKTASAGIE